MAQPVKRNTLLALILFILFSGLTFLLPLKMLSWFFAYTIPNVSLWVIVLLGNISSLSFAYLAGVIERITQIEEVLD